MILSQLRNLYHRGNVFKSFQFLRNRICNTFVVQFVIALFLIWLPTYLTEQYHVNFKEMTISALPWLFMFFLILFAGAISDKILNTGQSRFVARGVLRLRDLWYSQFQFS